MRRPSSGRRATEDSLDDLPASARADIMKRRLKRTADHSAGEALIARQRGVGGDAAARAAVGNDGSIKVGAYLMMHVIGDGLRGLRAAPRGPRSTAAAAAAAAAPRRRPDDAAAAAAAEAAPEGADETSSRLRTATPTGGRKLTPPTIPTCSGSTMPARRSVG